MKKYYFIFYAVIFYSCSKTVNDNKPNNQGLISIVMPLLSNNNARIQIDSIEVILNGPTQLNGSLAISNDSLTASGTFDNLLPGNYSISVLAFQNKDTIATGEGTAKVTPGKTTNVTISMNLILGNIAINIIWLPTEGLIAYYPFNGNTNDYSGYSHNGTVNGATLINDRFGNAESAYNFEGKEFITTSFIGVQGDSDRTISFWVKIDSLEGGGAVCSYGSLSGGAYFNPYVDSGDKAGIDINNETVNYTASNTGDGNWHHYIYEFSTQFGISLDGVKIYKDGDLLTSINESFNYDTYSLNTGSNLSFVIGDSIWGTNLSIDDIRFYDRVISNAEIQALYHEGGW